MQTFFRATTEGKVINCTEQLENVYGGIEPTKCIIVGSSPRVAKLSSHDLELVNNSHVPKFSVNYSGLGPNGKGWLIKPDLWTCFDPTNRFSGEILNDPSIMKFLHGSRKMDLVSAHDGKVCDCPNTYFINCEKKGFSDFFSDGLINHSLDSFIQALSIAYRLGFREFYCIGCDLRIRPSVEQIKYARELGIDVTDDGVTSTEIEVRGDQQFITTDLLETFVNACVRKNQMKGKDSEATLKELCEVTREEQYCFTETKSLKAAVSSDLHYFERVQYLRLARKNMCLNGVKLWTDSEQSRLYPFFDKYYYNWLETDNMKGFNPTGLYSTKQNLNADLPYTRDVLPYDWKMTLQERAKRGCCGGCKDKKKELDPNKDGPILNIEVGDKQDMSRKEELKALPLNIPLNEVL